MEVGVEVSGVACGSFNQAGTYFWQAVYSGDSNNQGSSSLCTSETVAVGSAQTTLATTLSSSSTLVGSSAHATPSLRGYSAGAGGTGTYTVDATITCATAATAATSCQPFTITQSVSTPSNFFQWAPGSFAYDANCNTLETTVTQSGGITTVQFSTTSAEGAGTYYIGIKYRTSNVLGETRPSPSTVVYTYSTISVGGSTSQLSLVQTHSH